MKLSTRSQCFLVCVVLLLAELVPLKSHGQQRLSPVETVDRFLIAKEAQRWAEAAKYLDQDALAAKRDTVLKYAAELPARTPSWTVEQFMKMDSTMPRAVAEYQLRKMEEVRKTPRFMNPWIHEFADVKDSSMLRAMTPLQLGASWTRAHDERYIMSTMSQNVPGCDSADVASVFAEVTKAKPQHRMLGSVVIDSIAYVLFQDRVWQNPNSAPVDLDMTPEILGLRKVRGEWRVYPAELSSGGLTGLGCSTVDSADERHQ